VKDPMPKDKQRKQKDETTEVLKSLLIVELAKAGVPQPDIRKIVGCDMWRVSEIARYFRKRKKDAKTN
jgi:hypothetical protein